MIPDHATRITAKYSGPLVYFHIWESPVGSNNYVWSALGQQGEERGFEAAIAAARNYIRFGSEYRTNEEIIEEDCSLVKEILEWR